MNLAQLQKGLEQAFFNENHRIVFWYDAEKSFTEEVNELLLDEVQIINMEERSTFEIKIKLELQETEHKYLLYFPYAEPDMEDDWLLDIKLYSRSFYADRFSIIFNQLGLQKQSLREHLSKRDKFCANKQRLASLKRYIRADADEQEIDMAMIATVLKAENTELIYILMALADEMAEGHLALGDEIPSMLELEKFGLTATLMQVLKQEFGYEPTTEEQTGEKPFNLGTFLTHFIATSFCESLGEVPTWASSSVMPSINSRATTIAYASRWCDSSSHYQSFDYVSKLVSLTLKIEERLEPFKVDQLVSVMTFEAIEIKIIRDLVDLVPDADEKDLAHYANIISERLDGYWASRYKYSAERPNYRIGYMALQAAIELFTLKQKYIDGFYFDSCESIYKNYEKELYRFDTSYRHYCEASRQASLEMLKSLDKAIDSYYADTYLVKLSKNLLERVEGEQRLNDWTIPNVPNQYNFYRTNIEPLLNSTTKRRVAVIISDAFRYEAAVELSELINQKRYSQATLSSQLGVVPSYTTLGMASLLPHQTLDYKNASDDVLVDGKTSQGTAARSKILEAYKGVAFTAEEVMKWSRDEAREKVRNIELIYVYHNVIDARGDNSTTESETFIAVEQAIRELDELSRKLLRDMNISTLFITADHGFLYQQTKLDEIDRTKLGEVPEVVIKNKKRYVIGRDFPDNQVVFKGSTKETADTSSDVHFWIPKGNNRFHFTGGSRFVHGGIMPQEIVVPVILVKQLRGENAASRTKRKVKVISTINNLKVVNNIHSFTLMQSEMVTDLITPITVSVAIYDAHDTLVSSEETLTFDCTDQSSKEYIKHPKISLSGSDFDRRADYFLVIKDKDLNIELERYKVTIDLAFSDDFF
ncbi:BREX-1 system phosphatase PglZ type A [bacterium]|nr:BREX-1 system phosphatase PglZ type A [bacterium]